MIPRGAPLLALLCLAGQGCDTDVVDFPLKGQPPDLYPGACKITVSAKYRRCIYCPGPGADAWTETCEDLVCKFNPDDGGKSGCKDCFWISHPDEKCQICIDAQGTTVKDTCQASDMGP